MGAPVLCSDEVVSLGETHLSPGRVARLRREGGEGGLRRPTGCSP